MRITRIGRVFSINIRTIMIRNLVLPPTFFIGINKFLSESDLTHSDR